MSRFGYNAYGLVPPPPVTCDNRRLPVTGDINPLTAARTACGPNAFQVADHFLVLTRAIVRAIQMLDQTIGQLVDARHKICTGATPAESGLPPVARDWMINKLSVCIDDPRVWTAGTFVNRSVAEVIRRLVRVRNLIASNSLRYICGGLFCDSSTWAYVFPTDENGDCLPGTPPLTVNLCRSFWVPGRNPITREPVPAAVHFEFQAQTIIHEASHLTHCTEDHPSVTIGAAECLSQFVAATNGSPLDPGFLRFCAQSSRCRPGNGVPAAVGGFGAVPPISKKVRRLSFHPENAILPGRNTS